MSRHRFMLFVLLTACPGDDDGGGSGSTGTETTAPTTSSSSSMSTGSTADPSTSSESGEPSTSSGATTSSTTVEPESSSSTTSSGDLVWLQNDSWTASDGIEFQLWAGVGDCWGATYEIDNSLYPFDIVELEVAIGGAGDTQTFEVGVWTVDGNNGPMDPIDTVEVEITGDVGLEPHIDLEGLLDIPTIEDGSFAIVMCHTEHMGSPSIATDMDDTVDAQNNWVFQGAMGEWVQSPDFFGIAGDFIMRTGVRPAA